MTPEDDERLRVAADLATVDGPAGPPPYFAWQTTNQRAYLQQLWLRERGERWIGCRLLAMYGSDEQIRAVYEAAKPGSRVES